MSRGRRQRRRSGSSARLGQSDNDYDYQEEDYEPLTFDYAEPAVEPDERRGPFCYLGSQVFTTSANTYVGEYPVRACTLGPTYNDDDNLQSMEPATKTGENLDDAQVDVNDDEIERDSRTQKETKMNEFDEVSANAASNTVETMKNKEINDVPGDIPSIDEVIWKGKMEGELALTGGFTLGLPQSAKFTAKANVDFFVMMQPQLRVEIGRAQLEVSFEVSLGGGMFLLKGTARLEYPVTKVIPASGSVSEGMVVQRFSLTTACRLKVVTHPAFNILSCQR